MQHGVALSQRAEGKLLQTDWLTHFVSVCPYRQSLSAHDIVCISTYIWPVSFCIFNSQSIGLWAISMFACDLICNYVTVRLCFVFWPSYLSECFLVGVCVLSVPHLSLCVALPQPVFDSCCRFLLSFHSVSSFLPLYEFLVSRDWIWQWSFRVLWMQKLLII